MKRQIAFSLLILTAGFPLQAEEVKVTAYYPAPYGDYKEVQSSQGTGLATQSGNVGIGKTAANATEKLDVAGNVKFSGALMPGGSAGTAGQVLVSSGSGSAPAWSSNSGTVIYLTSPFQAKAIYKNAFTLAWHIYGLYASEFGEITIANLKASNAQMASETRTIKGIILEYSVDITFWKSANANKPHLLMMSKECGAGKCASSYDLVYVYASPFSSTLPSTCGAPGCARMWSSGSSVLMDYNNNQKFDMEGGVYLWIQRNDQTNFTIDPDGTISYTAYVKGYIV